MNQPQDLPLLFSFYFGDSAASAQRGASRRFKKWCRAFDQWVAHYKWEKRQDTLKHALLAWRRLVRQSGKMPWQLTSSDIDHHLAWLKQEGYALSTVNASLGFINSFFHWCDQQHVDSACPPGFNPAKSIPRTKLPRYTQVTLWSRAELDALLSLLKRDSSPLGKRDYAFFLARLSFGVPLKSLQQLTWGQIEQDDASAWVSWRLDGQKVRLPHQLWQALTDYLHLSGRLEGMVAGKYVFVPQLQPVHSGSGNSADDWLEHQPLSGSALISSLKLYGRQLGIAENKLTLMALRRSAIRLRLDQGESLKGMQVFMDTREKIKSTKYRLSRLPALPQDDLFAGLVQGSDAPLPLRETRLLQGDEGTTHGFYSHRRDEQAVRAVMAEDIQGMQQEIACLRSLMNLILEHQGDAPGMVDTYTRAAGRLAELIKAAELVKENKKDSWAYEVLDRMDEFAASIGKPPFSPQVREHALGLSSDGLGATGLATVEIASIRLLLRNLYKMALQDVNAPAYLHWVDLYGASCVRLAKLLKLGGGDESGRLERFLNASVNEAIRQVNLEFQAQRENDPG